MTTTDTEVTQGARDAAALLLATLHKKWGPQTTFVVSSPEAPSVIAGKRDAGALVQAFARFEAETLARHRTLTPAQAAGPVLMEALKRVLDRGYVSKHIGEEHDDHMMIVAAITQAEGPQA